MQLSHTRPVASAVFDDPNLVSCAGLVPMAALAQQCGLAALADEHLSVPTDKGANAGAKVSSLVAGMVAGADSIDDMALLRHGAMGTVFDRPYAPSTLGSFLREFTFGHVRQLDAVAARLLSRLHARTPLLAGIDGPVLVDIDDTIIEVHGHAKQGSGYGYSGVRGLNALIATVTTEQAAPVIAGQRLRKGACGSARGAARMVADTLATVDTACARSRVDRQSRWCGRTPRSTAIPPSPRRSAAGPTCRSPCAWTRKSKPPSPPSTTTHGPPSNTPTPSTTRTPNSGSPAPRSPRSDSPRSAPRRATEQVPGRLVVRRIPDLNQRSDTGRPPCSTPGASMRSSPPPTLRHRHRRQDPPRPRDHRAGPRRPQGLRPGSSALGTIQRQRRLAGAGRDRVQPHPRRGHPHRAPRWPRPDRDHPRAP